MNITLPQKVSRLFFAIACIAFGIQHFIFNEFIIGRPPKWPEWLPGQFAFAYISGVILITAGLAIISKKKVKIILLVTGTMILLWAGLRNLSELITTLDYGVLLTTTNKALTFGFGAFLVATTFINEVEKGGFAEKWLTRLAPFARYTTGFFLFASGVQHFLFADFVKFLIPAWIPGASFWVYFSGIALIAGGLGLLTGIQRTLAASLSGWMIFIWLLVLHIPRALAAGGNISEWTAVFEALAVSGLLFIMAERKK